MQELKAYKLSLLLPLVLSAACAPFLSVDLRLPEWCGTVILFTAYSGLIGGVPYLMLVVLLLFWARGRTEKQFRRALILAPVLMLPIFSLFIVIVALFLDWESVGWETANGLLFYVPFVLGYGYAYVVLVLCTIFLLKRLGAIVPSRAI